MKTSAPRMPSPRESFTSTCTVMGSVRERTGFGENCTWDTISRSPFGTLVTETTCPGLGGEGVPSLATTLKFDTAERVPESFRAVTRTRSARPVSRSTTWYWLSAAPSISLQLVPSLAQRNHLKLYVIGCSPTHEPRFAVSWLPVLAVPEIVGGLVFAGRAETTTLVGLDVDVACPSAFVAVTCDRILNPASAGRRTYVLSLALEMRMQSDASGRPRP